MDATLIIATSILLQLIAAAVAVRQMRDFEMRKIWLAIAAALLLMGVPRTITLIRMINGEITRPPDLESELVALDVSFLMGIGIAYASKLFRSLKRAQSELARSQQIAIDNEMRLRTLFENAPDAIINSGTDGIIVSVNRAAEDLLGQSSEEIVGRRIADIAPFRAYLRSRRGAKAEQLTGSLAFEISYPGSSDQQITAEVRGFSVEIHGELHQVWFARDLTEKRRLQSETDRLQDQLRHAERLQAVGTLAGGIAHDFNNILTPIVGYTELAIKSSPDGNITRDHLENVIRGAMRAKNLVKQILAFSRQGTKQTIPVQLQPLVKESLALLRASLPTTIEIDTDIDPSCGVVMADPGQIHQILMNLCINASHAIGESCGTLTVRLDTCQRADIPASGFDGLQEGRYARLSIGDTGHGMDCATLARIFEPFFTTKSDGKGSGLGLSVVHGIVSSHNGAIVAKSELGVGTTFTVYLPLHSVPQQIHEVSDETPVQGSEHVLVVDDEPDIAEMMADTLECYGFKVTTRTSSREGLEAFRANPHAFDVILTDQTMPHMTGVELTAEARKIRPDIPVVVMTGFSEMVMPSNYRSFGLDGYLMKPILAGPVTRMIRSVCSVRQDSAMRAPSA